MAAPWEKYAAPAAPVGPWSKYAAPAATAPPVAPKTAIGETIVPPPPGPTLPEAKAAKAANAGGQVSFSDALARVGGALKGITDYGLQGASMVGAGLGGLGQAALNLIPGAPHQAPADFINEHTYQPGPEGQALGEAVAAPIEMAGQGYGELAKLGGASPDTAGEISNLASTGLSLGTVVAGGPRVGALEAPHALERPSVSDVNAPVQTARSAGYDLRPSDINAAMPSERAPGTFRERFQNAEELKKSTTQKNQIQSTTLAGEELGLGGTKRLGDNELNSAKAPHFKAYEAANAALRQIPPSAEFSALVARGAQEAQLKGTPSTTKVLGALRRKSAKNIASDDVKTQEAGYVTMDLADSIEEGFGQQLEAMGDKNLFDQYQTSRQALAKIHDVESSLRGGQVDAGKLAQIQRKYPGRLTGRLKMIADTAENFPNVTGSSLKTAAGAGAGEVPASKTGIVTSAAKAITRNLPGMDIRSERFQNKFGTEAAPAVRSYFGEYGTTPEAPVAPPATPQYETLPTNVMPSRAQTLSGDLGLAPEPIAGAQAFPPAPEMLTAEQIPPVRGDVNFRGTPNTSLAGELGLAPEAAPPEGLPFTTEPNVGLAEGLGLAPPRLREQGKMKVEAPQRPELSLTEAPGRAGKKQVTTTPAIKHAVTKGGQHTFRIEDGGELTAKDLPDEGRFQITESAVAEGQRGEGRGTALYKAALAKAKALGRNLASDMRVSEPAQKQWAAFEKSGVKVKKNPATRQASGELVSKSELKPVFEVVTE